jgi:DNA processing protein
MPSCSAPSPGAGRSSASGQRPDRFAFPRRNRVIAALSQAVLVVEAGARSGALITADHALEIGRDVLAVPGPIDSEASRGANALIFDGATPVLDEAGLLELLGERRAADGPGAAGAAGSEASSGAPDEAGRALLAALGAQALALDELVEAAGVDVARARSALIALELEGRVRRLDGGRYARLDPGAGRGR